MFKAFFNIAIVAVFFLICFVPWIDVLNVSGDIDLGLGLTSPSFEHWLGTDELGRDMLVRISSAFRDTVLPLWFFVIVAFLGGTSLAFLTLVSSSRLLGVASRLLGSGAFLIVLIPLGVTVFCFSVYFQKNGLFSVIYSIFIVVFAKAYLNLKQLYQKDHRLLYWDAHEAIGGNLLSRVWRYGICQLWSRQLMCELIFYLKVSIVAEVSVSYLGFGAQEPVASIGNILASHFAESLRRPDHIILIAWMALLLAISIPGLIRSLWGQFSRENMVVAY